MLPLAAADPPEYTEIDARKAKAPPAFSVKAPAGAPNVVVAQGERFASWSPYVKDGVPD